MGSLKKFNLNRIKKKFKITYFFETGTWRGDGVAHALNSSFERIYSSEIIEEIAKAAKKRFEENTNVEIITNNSIYALKSKCSELNGNCIFWLDAHFPGAEEGLKNYNDVKDESLKLPLNREIEIIASRKKDYADVILIDDLRIYEDGPFESGNMPDTILKPEIRNIQFVYDCFAETHVIIKSYRQEGYLLVLPKREFVNNNILDFFYTLANKVLKKIY